jgi:succinoglycan biosynthesis transport protein ExoP
MLRKVERTTPNQVIVTGELISPTEIFAAFRNMIRRQGWIILAVVVLAIASAVIYVLVTPTQYTAMATVIIDGAKSPIFAQQSNDRPELPPDTQVVDSQVEILSSEKIALRVIDQFKLAQDPEFVGSGAGLLGYLRGLAAFARDHAPDSDQERVNSAAAAFATRLTVSRVRLTSLIEVSFRAGNPKRAADLANATAYAYLADQRDAKVAAAKQSAAWLQDRIKELSEQATAAERAVVEYKADKNLVTVESPTGTRDHSLNEQKLQEFNTQLVQARAATSEAKARLDRIQKIISEGVPDATVADTLNNTVVSNLRARYLELASRENDWSTRYGANHLAAVDLRNQMLEIKESIRAELQRLAETYKSDYEIAKQREESIQTGLAEAVSQAHADSKAEIVLGELKSTAQTYRALYDVFAQRYMESIQQQSLPITDARVIAEASPPFKKSHPQSLLILAIASLGGLTLGLAVGQLRELLDKTFRTGAQVEARLGVDCLATLPLLVDAPVRDASSLPEELTPSRKKKPRHKPVPKSPIGYVVEFPFSRFTEAIRSIKIAIDLKHPKKSDVVVAFTSTLPNEGKSTIAASLAQLITHAGASTILVDCDLRNPSLTRMLAPAATEGFFDVINGDARLEDAILVDPTTGLDFLPQAMKTRFAHTDEALASDATRRLFDDLRKKYEYVIVDCSPLAPVVDVRATTTFVDHYVYVIEWGSTKFDVAEHSLDDAFGVYQKLVGAVLNKADISTLARYDGFGTSYYHNKHYKKYGYVD